MPRQTSFWDKNAPKYAASPIKDMDSYNHTLGRTKSYLKADDHAIELGCGTGSTALLLAPYVRKITATDISGKMIEIAKEKAWNDTVENIDFVQADLANSKVDEPVDAVLAFNLLHLVEDLPGALAHIGDLLPKDGLFISKTACLGDGKWYFRPLIAMMRLVGFAPFVGVFGIAHLEKEIERAGFTIIETGNFPDAPPNRYVVARRR